MTAVVFPDAELWATGYLRGLLAGRAETYAQDVHVDTKVPADRPDRLVTIRRDGGRRLDVVRTSARLGINVWAATEQDVNDLARLIHALVGDAAGHGPVVRVSDLTGPSPVIESAPQQRRFLTAEVILRGSTL